MSKHYAFDCLMHDDFQIILDVRNVNVSSRSAAVMKRVLMPACVAR
jgi:hypothetical protein